MLQSYKPETAVFVPVHVIFERRASNAYTIEESALAAASLQQGGIQIALQAQHLLEQQESDAYRLEESALAVAPFLAGERQPTSAAPVLEREVAEPVEYVPAAEPEARSVQKPLTQVKFRQALIEVDDPGDFWDGVTGGQVAAVEEQRTLTGALLFELFEDAVRDLDFSETWLAGYLLGLSDALLRHRKVYPRDYTALLKPLNYQLSKRRRS